MLMRKSHSARPCVCVSIQVRGHVCAMSVQVAVSEVWGEGEKAHTWERSACTGRAARGWASTCNLSVCVIRC